jgi:hypothetical protein
MNGAVVALVMLTGPGCYSPIEQQPNTTIVYKVPCAIVIREQTANPFKRVQEANTVTPAKAVSKPKKKKRRVKKRR